MNTHRKLCEFHVHVESDGIKKRFWKYLSSDTLHSFHSDTHSSCDNEFQELSESNDIDEIITPPSPTLYIVSLPPPQTNRLDPLSTSLVLEKEVPSKSDTLPSRT